MNLMKNYEFDFSKCDTIYYVFMFVKKLLQMKMLLAVVGLITLLCFMIQNQI